MPRVPETPRPLGYSLCAAFGRKNSQGVYNSGIASYHATLLRLECYRCGSGVVVDSGVTGTSLMGDFMKTDETLRIDLNFDTENPALRHVSEEVATEMRSTSQWRHPAPLDAMADQDPVFHLS